MKQAIRYRDDRVQETSGLHNALEDARWERDVLYPFLRNYRP